jgi:hypothetical protein
MALSTSSTTDSRPKPDSIKGERRFETINNDQISSRSGKRHESLACNASSCPIPFPHYHIKRTKSETQLCEQMEIAEIRDRIMLCRITQGMKQMDHSNLDNEKYVQLDEKLFGSSKERVLHFHHAPLELQSDSSNSITQRSSISNDGIFDLEE